MTVTEPADSPTPGDEARPRSGDGSDRPHVKVAIVGAGFAGLAMAVALKQAGIDDFVVLERGDDVGGTWRDNTYPGAACDVPSHLYSFSFAPNPGWTRSFSPQREILDYLRATARRFDVLPHIRFGAEVTAMRWVDTANVWRVDTADGGVTAQFLVPGTGALSEPKLPAVPGIDRFEGTLFHSARWDHDHSLRDETVAVIGTGASSIQFVPEIQPHVRRLHVFQRTPPWVIPRTDRPLRAAEHRLFRSVPTAQRLARAAIYWGRELYAWGFKEPARMQGPAKLARAHLARQIADPDLRARLTPDYTIGCKRILISNDWYPALTQPNVEVVSEGIAEVLPHAVVSRDGAERPVDTIICGTGFHVTDFPAGDHIHGAGGASLSQVWTEAGSMEAYLGSAVAGFPNLFLLVGPNTGLGHTSMVFMIESQVSYVLDAIRHVDRAGATTVEVRPDVQDTYNRDLQHRLSTTVWNQGGCKSWYLDANGRNTSLWPGYTWRFRQRTRRFDPWSYVMRYVAARPEAAGDEPGAVGAPTASG